MSVFSEIDFRSAVASASSLRQLETKFGMCRPSIKNLIADLHIDCGHFLHKKAAIQLIGKRFGNLTVLNEGPRTGGTRRSTVLCRCDCGIEKSFRTDAVKHGRYISCGCLGRVRHQMRGHLNPAYNGVGEITGVHMSRIKQSATKRNLPFEITKEFLWELFLKQNRKCALTDLPLVFGRADVAHETTASVDRIDSAKGYTKDNVQWVWKDINILKSKYENEYFIEMCNLVAKCNPR